MLYDSANGKKFIECAQLKPARALTAKTKEHVLLQTTPYQPLLITPPLPANIEIHFDSTCSAEFLQLKNSFLLESAQLVITQSLYGSNPLSEAYLKIDGLCQKVAQMPNGDEKKVVATFYTPILAELKIEQRESLSGNSYMTVQRAISMHKTESFLADYLIVDLSGDLLNNQDCEQLISQYGPEILHQGAILVQGLSIVCSFYYYRTF